MSAIMRAASWIVWSGLAMLTLRVIASLTLIVPSCRFAGQAAGRLAGRLPDAPNCLDARLFRRPGADPEP
ncbi:hypothetical protein GCM10008026_25940 [Chelatococcus composti]|nr:hypothetical protein GCM10008026_25940 [Chelatococcus composti]